jgi:hypothetical protein
MVAKVIDRRLARLSKVLVDTRQVTFDEAQAAFRALTLEVVVGPDAITPAAHAAVLTAVSVGSRTFVGGVRVVGNTEQRLNSALPVNAITLAEATLNVGTSDFTGSPSRRVLIGTGPLTADKPRTISAWWNDWRAGVTTSRDAICDDGNNPLTGIVAGALSVGAAFEDVRSGSIQGSMEVDLWPVSRQEEAPSFAEVFLPGALWLVGLGNLGQAFLWALAALPYINPADVSIVLQDYDRVTEENWATSVLVKDMNYGTLKTKIAEEWATAKGFDARRVDRRLLASDRLDNSDPRIALCGVDKIEPRKLMANTGFDCIVDAGLGRNASDFDRYRVTVFDHTRPIDKHFAGMSDVPTDDEAIFDVKAYQQLQEELGRCGTAELAGASVAIPYVSAIAAAVAVSRVIAITSGCMYATGEVRRLSEVSPKIGSFDTTEIRAARHAGNPAIRRR